ncbi:SURF1 family protein [Algihabitans albus]|uniref:SURF1 family protein n=1 Tax=Algihabitans albus TaxID=2164067 RepID=UPI000E5CF334|nr:SURF1 family protein [Algihabitans albus]
MSEDSQPLRDGRLLFRPKLLPSLLTLLMVAVLIGLGSWQLQRLEWKIALLADMEQRTAAAPITLGEALASPGTAEYRPIRVTGRWLHDREMRLLARTYRGEPGLHIVTPLALSDGQRLLVDRGWVSLSAEDPALRADGQPEGIVTLVGLARLGGWQGRDFLRPENDPAANAWLWMDLPEMAEAAGLSQPVTQLYLAAIADQHSGRYPIGGQTRVELKNDHLQYAITWFTLAAAAAVIFVLSQRRRRDEASA